MSYVFRDIIIYAFDVHTTVAPFLNDKCFIQSLRFISSPDDYQLQSVAGNVVETKSFKIRPLTVDDLAHHFWGPYSGSWQRELQPDFWRLQLPLRCELKTPALTLDAGDPAIEVYLKPEVFLSAIGWSTNLYIRLKGSFDPAQLQSIVSRLFHLQQKPFSLDNQPRTITEVFGHFSARIRDEFYEQKKPLVDRMTVEKSFVISPVTYSGEALHYCPPVKDDHPPPSWTYDLSADERMSDTDCASMLGILYGSPLTPGEWFDKSYRDFSHRKLKESGFALVDLNRGTFLFMQVNAAADAGKKLKKALWCYTSNVRLCSMMISLLTKFYDKSARYEAENLKIKQLRQSIKITLKDLPSNCLNAVCRTLHGANKDVAAILSEAAGSEEKEKAA
jgi:hypothetical protein